MTVIGPPDCPGLYGECPSFEDWTTDPSVEIPLGKRVKYREFVAVVQASDAAAGTVTIEFVEMYKPDEGNGNELRRCHVDLSGDLSGSYPEDCRFDLVPAGGGRVVQTVLRSEIRSQHFQAWSPIGENAVPWVFPGGGAFGPQYAFTLNQAETYVGEYPYSEFIEVEVDEPVFVFRIIVGMPNGAGAIVGIKLKDPAGQWVSVYQGRPLIELDTAQKQSKSYVTWTPPGLCRTHFKSKHLRLELDTIALTGVRLTCARRRQSIPH